MTLGLVRAVRVEEARRQPLRKVSHGVAATVGDAAIDLLALTGVLKAARGAGVSPGACLPPVIVSRTKNQYKAASGSR